MQMEGDTMEHIRERNTQRNPLLSSQSTTDSFPVVHEEQQHEKKMKKKEKEEEEEGENNAPVVTTFTFGTNAKTRRSKDADEEGGEKEDGEEVVDVRLPFTELSLANSSLGNMSELQRRSYNSRYDIAGEEDDMGSYCSESTPRSPVGRGGGPAGGVVDDGVAATTPDGAQSTTREALACRSPTSELTFNNGAFMNGTAAVVNTNMNEALGAGDEDSVSPSPMKICDIGKSPDVLGAGNKVIRGANAAAAAAAAAAAVKGTAAGGGGVEKAIGMDDFVKDTDSFLKGQREALFQVMNCIALPQQQTVASLEQAVHEARDAVRNDRERIERVEREMAAVKGDANTSLERISVLEERIEDRIDTLMSRWVTSSSTTSMERLPALPNAHGDATLASSSTCFVDASRLSNTDVPSTSTMTMPTEGDEKDEQQARENTMALLWKWVNSMSHRATQTARHVRTLVLSSRFVGSAFGDAIRSRAVVPFSFSATPSSAAIERFFAMLSKTDARDKMLATLQYAAMIVGGMKKESQTTVLFKALGGARRPFRFVKPLETLYPLLDGVSGPPHIRALSKAKAMGMAFYYMADHVVWALSTGLLKNRKNQENVQRMSWYGLLLGSASSAMIEMAHISRALLELSEKRKKKIKMQAEDGTDEEEEEEEDDDDDFTLKEELRTRCVALAHMSTQMLLCLGLLQVVPFKPRVTGTFGIITSALVRHNHNFFSSNALRTCVCMPGSVN